MLRSFAQTFENDENQVMKKHKLDIIWSEFGDNCIHDKVAKTTTVLPFKPIEVSKSLKQKSLCPLKEFYIALS